MGNWPSKRRVVVVHVAQCGRQVSIVTYNDTGATVRDTGATVRTTCDQFTTEDGISAAFDPIPPAQTDYAELFYGLNTLRSSVFPASCPRRAEARQVRNVANRCPEFVMPAPNRRGH